MARWLFGANKIEDDRRVRHDVRQLPELGSSVAFRVWGGSFRLESAETGRPAAERSTRIARRVLQRDSTSLQASRCSLAMIIGMALIACGWGAARADSFALAVSWILGFLAIIGLLRLVWVLDRRRDLRERLQLQSLPHACLACGYELDGLSVEPDGCTVCPECGSAWRFPIEHAS